MAYFVYFNIFRTSAWFLVRSNLFFWGKIYLVWFLKMTLDGCDFHKLVLFDVANKRKIPKPISFLFFCSYCLIWKYRFFSKTLFFQMESMWVLLIQIDFFLKIVVQEFLNSVKKSTNRKHILKSALFLSRLKLSRHCNNLLMLLL